MINLVQYRERANGLLSEYAHVKLRAAEEANTLAAALRRVQTTESAQQVAQTVAQAVQRQAHQQIAALVTKCLHAVFEDPYDFQIQFDRKRGRTEATLLFVRDGVTLSPTKSSGGGVIDLAAFALRLACLVLARPKLRKLLVTDENFKFLSEEYRPQVRQMMELLSKELGVQFITVTHSHQLEAGKLIEL